MGGLGMRELIIMLLVVLVMFGAKKLRTVGSDLGHAVRGFKTAMSEGEGKREGEGEEDPSTPPTQIRSEGLDAASPEIAKKSEAITERSP